MFKVNEAVTIYDVVEMMEQARDMVPKSVVLNPWLKTNIMLQFLQNEIKDRKDDTVYRARHLIKVSVFESEHIINAQIVHDAKVDGEGYLKSFETLEEDMMPTAIQAEEIWYTDTVSHIWELLGDLREIEFISDLAPDELDYSNDAESSLPIVEAPSIGDRMAFGIACAIKNFENQFLDDNQDDDDIDVLLDVAEEKKGSLKDVVDAAKAMHSES